MGTLVAMRYPTNLLLRAADHTYVQCGTGARAWGCWGGKTGGTTLRSGEGSTNQADAIAEPNERAGIKCYAINGVCHQAANRILLPAGIIVSGAKGYWLSSSLYGTYGRVRALFGLCKAPFNQHAGVTGDLPQCLEDHVGVRSNSRMDSSAENREADFLKSVYNLYARADRISSDDEFVASRFLEQHLLLTAEYRLGAMFSRSVGERLSKIHTEFEKRRLHIETLYDKKELRFRLFAVAFNDETLRYQDLMADALAPEQYRALFGLEHDERIVLVDPEVVNRLDHDS